MSPLVPLGLKAFHVTCACFYLGGGMVSAWYALRAPRSGDLRVVAWVHRELVVVDWVFTLPAALGLLASGLGMVLLHGHDPTTPWIAVGLASYGVAGACWIPALFLQLRMREQSRRSAEEGTPLPAEFHRIRRIWMALGFPAFGAALLAIWAMTTKNLWIG